MTPTLWAWHETVDAGALTACFDAWRAAQPGLSILALASEHSPAAVPALQAAANQAGLPLAGALVPGLIAGGAVRRAGVLLLALDATVPLRIVPLPRSGDRTDAAAVDALAAFALDHAADDGNDTLLLLVDAMTPDVASVLDQLYLAVGNQLHYAGSNIGSETFRPVPCVFDNQRLVGDAALAVVLPRHPGAALAHHYGRSAPLSVATASRGNRIGVIDGQPAFDAYRDLIGNAHGVALTRENFYQHAVHFPLALHLAEGEPLVRIPVAVEDDGSLVCAGEVPEAALLSIVEAAPPDSPDTAQAVAAGVRPHRPSAVLAFYCAGRLLHHGEAAANAELAELDGALEGAPLFGCLSLGEIANYEGAGYPRFHNATLVALPWT